jgi:GrpB-like predicted nucleotidyltransferase (UPF0157 family)
MKKYTFTKYKTDYPQLYQRERTKLKKILPRARFEHIGSTAIPKLGGKGIIDILIGVKKNQIKTTIKKL